MSAGPGQPPRYWYGDAPVPLHARALSGLFALGAGLRRDLYRRGLLRTQRVQRPVIVVGNLVAGGSGKTPLTIAIVERLRAEGWNPGVASRGYGRADASKALWVEPATPAAQAGKRFGVSRPVPRPIPGTGVPPAAY